MFGIGIRYLMGWAMAAVDGAKKEIAEWPPHPDRVFMALAAAWFETGKDADEGTALRWLEELSECEKPGISASPFEQRHAFKDRNVRPVTSFVPVNDTSMSRTQTVRDICSNPDAQLDSLKDIGLALVPEFRPRQPRAFPVAVPHNPIVYLVWQDNIPRHYIETLANLCRKVVSVGHSASLVQMWLTDDPPQPNLVPTDNITTQRLRVFGPGRLGYLEARFNREAVIAYADLDAQMKNSGGNNKKALQSKLHEQFPKGKPLSLRPEPGLWQGYGPVTEELKPDVSGTVFDQRLLVLGLSGKRLTLSTTLKLTEALRGALLAACPQPIPEWLSGHTADRAATKLPHVALLPLSFVDHEHADGRLMGVALALPRDIAPADISRCLDPFLWDMKTGAPSRIRLFDGLWFECHAELELRESPPWNLCAEAWVHPSRVWASVTPVVLDRHFDGKDKWEKAAEIVKNACERINLPRPAEVLLHPVSRVRGVPHAREFPYITRKKDSGRMHHVHAVIVFEKAVHGPVLVGAGRFRGYGLCRPMDRREEETHG
jgi:CRISPR-associated protein Csb2